MEDQIVWATQLIAWNLQESRNSLGKQESDVVKLIEALKTVWKESYPDTQEYIDFFFQNRFNPDKTIVVINKGDIIGGGYLLPVMLDTLEGERPGYFGYALGVLKEYRGQGLTGKIHEFIYNYCDECNSAFLIHPANDKLAAYYSGTGLATIGYLKKVIFSNNSRIENGEISLVRITSTKYKELRDNFFHRKGYARWDEEAIDYAVRENYFCGGFCNKLIYGSKEYAVFGKLEKKHLILLEATIPESLLTELIPKLATYTGANEVTVYLPSESAYGTLKPWLMGYNVPFQNIYCNLLLN